MRAEFIIEGPKKDIEKIWEEFKRTRIEETDIGSIFEKQYSLLDRPTLGIEPITYFVISFSAHLGASIVHDMLSQKIKNILKKYTGEINISERYKDK